jgi:hypothetical protein
LASSPLSGVIAISPIVFQTQDCCFRDALRSGVQENGALRRVDLLLFRRRVVKRASRDWRITPPSPTGAWAGERTQQAANARTERAVIAGTAKLQQKIGASSRPSHLQRFVYPSIDKEVRSASGNRSADPQTGAISLGAIQEPVALTVEITVDFVDPPR